MFFGLRSSDHSKEEDPILLIVSSPALADLMQREMDPLKVYVIAFGQSLCGRRFSAVVNTVRLPDLLSEIEKMQFEQWMMENVPTKLRPGKKIFHTHRFLE